MPISYEIRCKNLSIAAIVFLGHTPWHTHINRNIHKRVLTLEGFYRHLQINARSLASTVCHSHEVDVLHFVQWLYTQSVWKCCNSVLYPLKTDCSRLFYTLLKMIWLCLDFCVVRTKVIKINSLNCNRKNRGEVRRRCDA